MDLLVQGYRREKSKYRRKGLCEHSRASIKVGESILVYWKTLMGSHPRKHQLYARNIDIKEIPHLRK